MFLLVVLDFLSHDRQDHTPIIVMQTTVCYTIFYITWLLGVQESKVLCGGLMGDLRGLRDIP